mgnify:CR=1 FL=1|jgi:hypothetical protein
MTEIEINYVPELNEITIRYKQLKDLLEFIKDQEAINQDSRTAIYINIDREIKAIELELNEVKFEEDPDAQL